MGSGWGQGSGLEPCRGPEPPLWVEGEGVEGLGLREGAAEAVVETSEGPERELEAVWDLKGTKILLYFVQKCLPQNITRNQDNQKGKYDGGMP